MVEKDQQNFKKKELERGKEEETGMNRKDVTIKIGTGRKYTRCRL